MLSEFIAVVVSDVTPEKFITSQSSEEAEKLLADELLSALNQGAKKFDFAIYKKIQKEKRPQL